MRTCKAFIRELKINSTDVVSANSYLQFILKSTLHFPFSILSNDQWWRHSSCTLDKSFESLDHWLWAGCSGWLRFRILLYGPRDWSTKRLSPHGPNGLEKVDHALEKMGRCWPSIFSQMFRKGFSCGYWFFRRGKCESYSRAPDEYRHALEKFRRNVVYDAKAYFYLSFCINLFHDKARQQNHGALFTPIFV